MLFITSLFTGKSKQITNLKQLGGMLEEYELDKFQEMTLMRMIRDDKKRVFGIMDAPRLMQKVTKKTLGASLDPGDRDERGNLRKLTVRETPNAADQSFLPWVQQQALTDARIVKGWMIKTPGRTRSFPDPPPQLLPYMPY